MRFMLGVLTALGGLVDVGNLVANPQAGAQYGMALTVYVLVAAGGVILYSEMSGRITAVTGQAGFEFLTAGLPRRLVSVNVGATLVLTVAMAAGEVGGAASVLASALGGPYRLWLVVVAAALAVAVRRLAFATLENVLGLTGLALLVLLAVLVAAHPDWSALGRGVASPWPPPQGSTVDYLETIVAQIGSMIIPYQLIFFSSGAAEEGWGPGEVGTNRWNVVLGYGLGTSLALALMADATVLDRPRHLAITSLGQVAGFGRLAGLGGVATSALAIGMLATTVGAALETSAAVGYTVGQRRGWPWGLDRTPAAARRFHRVVLATLGLATLVMLAGVDPVQLTDFTLVISAVALPLTYLPTWLRARDRAVMGRHANGRLANALAAAYFVGICVVAVAAVPLWVLAHL